jgi:hypothetical protein
MANRTGTPETLTAPKFEKGQSGNPGGQPASRQKLTTRFLNALLADFEVHGLQAIKECRETKPEQYVKVVASLLPKEVEIKRPLDELNDQQLHDGIRALERFLATGSVDQGTGETRQ